MQKNGNKGLVNLIGMGIFAATFSNSGIAQQPYPDHLKEKIIQSNVKWLAKAGSQQMIPMLGDLPARNAKQIGEKLIELNGREIPIRIVGNKSVPTAIGNLEIVLPHRGMDKYTDTQVLFVIAHELAHIELNHASARVELAAQDCPELDLNPKEYVKQLNECIHENLGANKVLEAQLNSMRRLQEHEADLWAVKFLSHHELLFDYKGALEKSHKYAPNEDESHPSLTKRFAFIEKALLM